MAHQKIHLNHKSHGLKEKEYIQRLSLCNSGTQLDVLLTYLMCLFRCGDECLIQD